MSDTEEAAARGYLQSAGYAVLPGSIPERQSYREAQNRGAAITETRIRRLNERADALMEALLCKSRAPSALGKSTSKQGRGRHEEDRHQ